MGFTDYAAYSAWGNNVNAQVAAVQRNDINAYINNAVTCSMFSNGMIDMLQLSLEVSKELMMAGGPGGSYYTPTITTRTARNRARWNHIAAGVAISPFLTNPPSNAALAGEAAIGALSDSVTTWNTLRANGVSIFAGQPPFNHNARDYARGAMAASIVINSEMTRIHGGNHAMASSLEACHGQDPTDDPPGNTHPHIQFVIVLRHTPIDFQETLNWLTLKYGMLPQANGGYLHSTSATYVTPGTNQAYNVQSMFGSLNYMQKFSMHNLSHSDQREFHSITGYPVSRGGFANVSLSNPKGGAVQFVDRRWVKARANHAGGKVTTYHFVPDVEDSGNYMRATPEDFSDDASDDDSDDSNDDSDTDTDEEEDDDEDPLPEVGSLLLLASGDVPDTRHPSTRREQLSRKERGATPGMAPGTV